ncbi:hypothetical protein Ahy_Scaffold2g107595 isoform D [Arachis hypogaea]|uniref:Uncharacterized protein n=1 Tax=Arachis hypogaea TaxID=3818 RepID=A0A444WQF2_ARAHY|nr:hypothetical protein Ahy_Scaffold2g107595 isoform D [Arachis hypogaea]
MESLLLVFISALGRFDIGSVIMSCFYFIYAACRKLEARKINNIVKEEPGSSNVSGSSSSKDQPSQQISGLTIIRGNLGDPFWLVLATVPNSTNGRSMSHHMIPPVKVTMSVLTSLKCSILQHGESGISNNE